MDIVIRRLQEKVKQYPTNEALQRILTRLSGARGLDNATQVALKADIEALRAEGILDADETSTFRELLSSLTSDAAIVPGYSAERKDRSHDTMTKNSDRDAQAFRYVQANLADTTVPLVTLAADTPTLLPLELVELLNQAYFLHVLSTEPEKVLPPGKSLISVLSRPREAAQSEKSTLEEQVESMVHAAFWDEVRPSISLHVLQV